MYVGLLCNIGGETKALGISKVTDICHKQYNSKIITRKKCKNDYNNGDLKLIPVLHVFDIYLVISIGLFSKNKTGRNIPFQQR